MIRKIIYTLLISVVLMFAGAIAGLWVGMIIGGNLFTDMELFGMSGYELFGTIGVLLGAILGLTGGLMLRKNREIGKL